MTKLRTTLHITQKIKPNIYWLSNDQGGMVLQRTSYMPSPLGNLILKTMIEADRTGKPPLRLLLHSSLTPLRAQWDRHQSCKYTLGATFVIISQTFLIARHKPFRRATIARHSLKHVLWRAIAARVAFYSRAGLSQRYFKFQECSKKRSFPFKSLNGTEIIWPWPKQKRFLAKAEIIRTTL